MLNKQYLINCSKCKAPLNQENYNSGMQICHTCDSHVEVIAFPALYRKKKVERGSLANENEARCVYHQDKQADIICDQCGRLICLLCSIPVGDKKVCPQCVDSTVALNNDNKVSYANHIAWDSLALMLTIHPILIAVWYATFFTSLTALIISIVKFNKPQGPINRGKWRFILAITLSTVIMTGWIVAFVVGFKYFESFFGQISESMKAGQQT